MTSERRAYLIVIALTIGGMCVFGQGVEHWSLRSVFGIIAAGTAAFVSGMAKSPRDAALSDQTAPPVVAVDVKTDTTATTVTHAEAPTVSHSAEA